MASGLFIAEVKRFEEENNQVLLYLTGLAKEQICVPFVISESNKIDDRSNSTVKIYDYYKPEFEAFELYKINGCDDVPIPQLEIVSVSNIRSANMTNFNPDFVSMDVEMATPEGRICVLK